MIYKMIPIASPDIGPEETAAVNEVLKSGMLAQGPKVAELEKAFAEYTSTKYAVAVSSGTAAIHAALHVAGVGPGDEVITTPFSFIATINPILFVGARPVLVDIDPKTFNIDAKKIKAAITEKTKAIVPVHLYGQPCDFDELAAIAQEHNLAIVEDACQAVGAEYKGRRAGSLGDLGCFSLYATKNIMCVEGGMITTDNEEQLAAIRQFRQHGMTGPYEYAEIGYNYRMTDLQAAIAIEQLKKVDRYTNARQKNAAVFDEGLSGIKGIITPSIADDRTHAFHQYTIRITGEFPFTRDESIAKLKDKGIGAGAYYPKALHEYPHISKLGYNIGDFPIAEQAAREVVSLPVHPKVSETDTNKIVAVLKELAGA